MKELLRKISSSGLVPKLNSRKQVKNALTMLIYLSCIGLIFVYFNLSAEKQIKEESQLRKKIPELRFIHKSLHAELNKGTTPTSIADTVASMGLRPAEGQNYKLIRPKNSRR